MKTIELQIPAGKKAEWVNGVLTLVDEQVKDNRPVTERVKTFGDACNELGRDHPLVVEYDNVFQTPFIIQLSPDLEAYLKLRIIAAALNEGWQPKLTEDEVRYYPWFYLYTEDELSDKSDEWKQKHALMGAGDYETEYAGFAYAHSNYAPSSSHAFIASRLCLKNSDIAMYCGTQFIGLWADYLLIREQA